MAYGDNNSPMTDDEATLVIIHDYLFEILEHADDPEKVRSLVGEAFCTLDGDDVPTGPVN